MEEWTTSARTNHHNTPAECNRSKERSGSDLAAKHSHWWLEQNVGYEEDKRDDVLWFHERNDRAIGYFSLT